MKKTLLTACIYTAVTALLLGVVYPLAVTAVAHVLFPVQSSGQLLSRNGTPIGSRLIGQPFTGPGFFHSRPSAAGSGYDAANSSGSNLAPTSKALADRVQGSVAAERSANSAPADAGIPVDLVTASASGLDPDITPAAAFFQVNRVAHERNLAPESVRALVQQHIRQRQFGLLGEPRVNVLELNLDLLDHAPAPTR